MGAAAFPPGPPTPRPGCYPSFSGFRAEVGGFTSFAPLGTALPAPPRRGLRRRVGRSLGALAFLNVPFRAPGLSWGPGAGGGVGTEARRTGKPGSKPRAEQNQAAQATAVGGATRVTSQRGGAGATHGPAWLCLPPPASRPGPSAPEPGLSPARPAARGWGGGMKHAQHTRELPFGKRK